jgi:hypothetical protein
MSRKCLLDFSANGAKWTDDVHSRFVYVYCSNLSVRTNLEIDKIGRLEYSRLEPDHNYNQNRWQLRP